MVPVVIIVIYVITYEVAIVGILHLTFLNGLHGSCHTRENAAQELV